MPSYCNFDFKPKDSKQILKTQTNNEKENENNKTEPNRKCLNHQNGSTIVHLSFPPYPPEVKRKVGKEKLVKTIGSHMANSKRQANENTG